MRELTAETKAHVLAIHGGFVAAILSTLGAWWGPWVVVGLQAITLFLHVIRDRAAVSAGEKP